MMPAITSPRAGMRVLPGAAAKKSPPVRAVAPVKTVAAPKPSPAPVPSPAPAPAYSKNPIFNKLITQLQTKTPTPPPAIPAAFAPFVDQKGTATPSAPSPTFAPIRGTAIPMNFQSPGNVVLSQQPAGAPPSGAPPSMAYATNQAGVFSGFDSPEGYSAPVGVGQFNVPRGWLFLGGAVLLIVLVARR
jgi:hypothetical protein